MIVHVREKAPPPGTKRLEWFLLTTLPIESADDAERHGTACVGADYFRILKSGCRGP